MVGNRARIVCESLENRTLLAITAVNYDGQRLEVFGDAGNDFVEVRTEAGRLLVNNLDVGSSENLRDVVIRTDGGSDSVILRDITIKNNLEIDTEEGVDNVVLGVLGGPVDVVVGNQIKIDTGDDRDIARLTEVDARFVDVRTGAADDVVFPEFVSASTQIRIDTGDGGDVVIANDLVSKMLRFSGADGFDTLRLSNSSGKLQVNGFEIEIIV